MERFIGLDAGSVSVKLAVVDSRCNIIKTRYVRHMGRPLEVAYEVLKDAGIPASLSVTGSAGKLIAGILGLKPVNEIVAQSYSTEKLNPDIRTIFEMGGEDSKLILLKDGRVSEFSMNSVCAAGTGSFLDQQAERLNLSIGEFGRIALESKSPPRIAGRCSVFAKSDMIHLQQIATPLKDIVAGLCFAVARNFKGSICKNMVLPEPISFQGGVAANIGVVRAFREVFRTESLLVPEYFAFMPALGVAFKNIEEGVLHQFDIGRLGAFISSYKNDETTVYEPLKEVSCRISSAAFGGQTCSGYQEGLAPAGTGKVIKAYLGIDIGSISTNLAVMDEEGRLLSKRYLMTAGRPIEAVRQGLDEIGREIGNTVEILGVGTTGSGRYMIADFVGADIVKNEITAQARAATEIDPGVDTIFEIGGQDSKYISLEDGVIVDFEMNKACAAGTGSFLEEQAEKLGISIKDEFSSLAFRSGCPSALGERCTVFMENSLLARQQKGTPKEDLVAGLSYSIVKNYINRVVGNRKIGNRIFFQGGTAFNRAVIAAFEQYTGKQITVPPHHDVTGAIGMAIIAMNHMKENTASGHSDFDAGKTAGKCVPHTGGRRTAFKGFDLSKRTYDVHSFECKGCDNLCEINRVSIEGEKDPLFYGSRCEKYDVKRRKKDKGVTRITDLFAERESLLLRTHGGYEKRYGVQQRTGNRPRVGIPRIFFFHDFLPFWSTLLWELGFEVLLSSETKRQIINMGIESILAESCFPHKVAHGHIQDLINRGVDAILLPSFINLNPENTPRGFACPYVQTMPYVARIAFGSAMNSRKIKLLGPVVNLELGRDALAGELFRDLRTFRIPRRAIRRAMETAERSQEEFIRARRERGREVLNAIREKTVVIMGRAYNAFDPGINLEIPRKLSEIGISSIPMDYLPIENVEIQNSWPHMYWRAGQNILRAAEIVRNTPDLFAVYVGNFSCGPDSFIHRFFKETMSGKPFLHIEIDEHSADAGIITRCEAFLDSIMGRKDIRSGVPRKVRSLSLRKGGNNGKIVYIPRMSDHAFALSAAFESCGVNAEVMPPPDQKTVQIGRQYVSGKECFPCAVTTGDMVKRTMAGDFDPARAVFFMPSGSGPCRFGQYNILHRMVLEEIGLADVPIFSPNQDTSLYRDLGIIGSNFTKQTWKGIVAIDLLLKSLHENRPYEICPGESEGVYREYLMKVKDAIKGQNGAAFELLREIQSAFSRIPKVKNGRKPVIGIIGEIFVRHNAFSNEDLIRKIETLGGEAWLAPLEEWIYYVNLMALRKAVMKWKKNRFSRDRMKDVMNIYLTRFFQKRIEHTFSKPFRGFLKTLEEPETEELFVNALPYLHDSFEGETILSIGKAVDFVSKGASGIISAMPFGCMPGTIVGSLLKGIKQDTGIPFISIAYDGVETNCSEIQLEAFMHQAYAYEGRGAAQ